MEAPIVGRDREIAQLRAAVGSAARGAGRLVIVSGPAGIGKTRLTSVLGEVGREHGARVVRGYAVDDPGMPALWPWRRLARDLPQLAGPLTTDCSSLAARFEMFTDVADHLVDAAAAAGLVVLLEDVHWADPTSLLLLRHVAADIARSRLLVVATHRDVPGQALAEHLPDLLRAPEVLPIRLAGLTSADIAQWLSHNEDGVQTLADNLHARTGGNPLFIRLLLNTTAHQDDSLLDAATNPGLRRLVVAQSAGLPDRTRALLDAASVIGERIDVTVLAVVVGTTETDVTAALDPAITGNVLDSRTGQLAFAHSLIRDAVYAEIPPSERMALHRSVAIALEQSAEADTMAGIIAAQWFRASGSDASEKCVTWARRAARADMTSAAYDSAIAHLGVALDSIGPDRSQELRAELHLETARAHFAAGRVGPSIEQCSRAAELAQRTGRPELVGEAALVVHGISTSPVVDLIDRLCETALRTVPETEIALRARLFGQRALAAIDGSDNDAVLKLSQRAVELAEESGDSDALLDGLHARHSALSAPHFVEERRVLARRAIEVGWAAQRPLATLWGHVWNVDVGFQLGDLDMVDRSLSAVEQVATTRRLPIAQWHLHRCRAARFALVGNFEAGARETAAARDLAEKMDDPSMFGLYYAYHSEIDFLRLVTDDYRDKVEFLRTTAPPIPLVRVFTPFYYVIGGEIDTARATFEEFRTMAETAPVGPRWCGLIHHIGQVAILLDDAETAGRVYGRLVDFGDYFACDGSGAVFCPGPFALLLGGLARVMGRDADALDHYRHALELSTKIGARPYAALAKLGIAATLVTSRPGKSGPTSRETTQARQFADDAAKEFRRLDMPGPLREADAVLARSVSSRRAANPLSGRETQVALLISGGRSNRDIAAELVLSERTIEAHVRSILGKLGYSNRTEIAAWALREAGEG